MAREGDVAELKGLEHLLGKLHRMGVEVTPILADGAHDAVAYIHQKVPEYPLASRKPQPFKNAHQRRHVMWLIRTGQITVPYRRTGGLGRSVTSWHGLAPGALSRVDTLGDVVRGVIGTSLDYAKPVIDEDNQAEYHQGTWWTLQGVVRDNLKGVVKIFRDKLKDLVERS